MRIIRRLEQKDIEEVCNIGRKIDEFKVSDTSVFWSEEQLQRWSVSDDDVMLIVEDEGKIIGFIFFAHHQPTSKATFENIWVDPAYRNTGLALELLNNALNKLKSIGCEYIVGFVSKDNQLGRKFFKETIFSEKDEVIWIDVLIK